MKFNAGDCVSFNVNNTFLAGFISSTERGNYEIALCDFNQSTSPPASYFQNCQLFAAKFEMGETSISSLDIITMDPERMDQLPGVETVTHIKIPGFVAATGFQEVSTLSELQCYFDLGMDLRNGKASDNNTPMAALETKCFRGIYEFLKNIPAGNEFPTVKLYKRVDNTIHYFQIYGSSNAPLYLVIHWGKLGETGQFLEVKDKNLDDIREMYNGEIAKVRGQEYAEYEDISPMILQFKASDEWGVADDLDFRNEIWEYLDRFLFWTGNGSISGGDIGSGTVNLFFEAVTPELAVNTIVHALEEKKVDRPYLIALENDNSIEPSDEDSIGVKVMYPKDYQGTFFY